MQLNLSVRKQFYEETEDPTCQNQIPLRWARCIEKFPYGKNGVKCQCFPEEKWNEMFMTLLVCLKDVII
jgi:hypothetical protein